MKKMIAIGFAASFMLASCAGRSIVTSNQTASQIKADGIAAEWGEKVSYFDNENKIVFTTQSDNENIYLLIKTPDKSMQRKILASGINIEFETKGDKSIDALLCYPMPGEKMGRPGGFEDMGEPPFAEPEGDESGFGRDKRYGDKDNSAGLGGIERRGNEMLRIMLKKANKMNVEGFADSFGVINSKNSKGFAAAAGIDSNGIMACEIVIPFAELYGKNYAQFIKSNSIDLTINIDALELPSLNRNPGSEMSGGPDDGGMGGGMRPGGGIGGGMRPGGGGMGGGRPGGGMGMRNTEKSLLTSDTNIKLTVNIGEHK